MDPLNRVEPRIAAGLCHVVRAFVGAGLPYAIIGASALILQGIDLDRSTRDLDIAVALAGGLGRVREILTGAGMHTSRIVHRFSTPLMFCLSIRVRNTKGRFSSRTECAFPLSGSLTPFVIL